MTLIRGVDRRTIQEPTLKNDTPSTKAERVTKINVYKDNEDTLLP